MAQGTSRADAAMQAFLHFFQIVLIKWYMISKTKYLSRLSKLSRSVYKQMLNTSLTMYSFKHAASGGNRTRGASMAPLDHWCDYLTKCLVRAYNSPKLYSFGQAICNTVTTIRIHASASTVGQLCSHSSNTLVVSFCVLHLPSQHTLHRYKPPSNNYSFPASAWLFF